MSHIDLTPNVDAYFEEAVHNALAARKVKATGAAETYIAGLLSDYARGQQPTGVSDAPLTFQLRDALEARGAQRFQRLQSLGDAVLYLLGFFGKNLTRRGADPRYVMHVGSSAYSHASAMLCLGGSHASHDVLAELASKYERFVAVLREIGDTALAQHGSDTAVLRLYERWQVSGSEQLAASLNALGISPAGTGSGASN